MVEERDELVYAAGGALAALALAVVLIPFRGYTVASNFTFLFLILTIVVAEMGGRWAAVVTALCSALSLDFFLTQPYLQLSIAEKHDIIAFVGLAVCGLVVAAFAGRRGERRADLRAARAHLALLHAAIAELEGGATPELRAAGLLPAARGNLPLAAIAMRDAQNQPLAAEPAPRPAPEPILLPDSLALPEEPPPGPDPRPRPLPAQGGRIALTAGGRAVGWLDVWGSRQPASAEARSTLADLARILAAILAGRRVGPG